jgi:hypothetical protein
MREIDDDKGTAAGEDRTPDAAERCPDPGAVADHELDPVGLVAEIHDQVAGLLGSPCAPRCALSHPRLSREELGGRFLGLMAYPMLKGG